MGELKRLMHFDELRVEVEAVVVVFIETWEILFQFSRGIVPARMFVLFWLGLEMS